jgi:signal transduction histidine kinase
VIITVKPNARLDQGTFDRSGRWEEVPEDRLVVDLTTLIFVDAYAMVVLLTIMELWARRGDPVELILPERRGTRSYLARMHFFELMPEEVGCSEELPVVTEKPSALLPLTRLDVSSGEYAIEQLANFVYPQLPRPLAGAFVEALSEIGANVVQHAESEIGFLAAQRFEGGYQGRVAPRLLLVVADAGVGIHASLLPAFPDLGEASDEAAIELALQADITSKPGTNSGVGLTTALEYAEAFGGILRVRSGAGVVVCRPDRRRSESVPWMPGTVVAVELASPGRAL